MLRVQLRPGSRPARLRALVDEAYFALAGALPSLLRELAHEQRTFTGRPEPGPFAGPSALNPVIAGAPWLFWHACRKLPDSTILPIAEAGALLGAVYAIQDHLIDEQLPEPAGSALLAQALLERALRLLYREFPAGAPFWSYFDQLWAELRRSQALERQWLLAPAEISQADFVAVARAKAAPAVLTLAALVEVGAPPALRELGGESLMVFGAAAQLAHDVGDWRGDVRDGHFTFFLSRVAPPERFAAAQLTEAAVDERLDATWLDVDFLRLAEEWLNAARRYADELGCPAWRDYLERSGRVVDEELTRCLARRLVQRGLPANAG